MPERLSDAEIEAYRKRVTGVTPFPGGAVPRGAEAAKAALDNWHLRNLATIDGLKAELEAARHDIAELATLVDDAIREGHADPEGEIGPERRRELLMSAMKGHIAGEDAALTALAASQGREKELREAMLDTLGNLHVIDATAGTGVFGDDPADRFAKIRAKRLEAHNRIVDAMNIPAPRACDAATPPP